MTATVDKPTRAESDYKLRLAARTDERAAHWLFTPGERSGKRFFAVPSRSIRDRAHVVMVEKTGFREVAFACSPACQRYHWLGFCSHIALVERYLADRGQIDDPLETSDQ